MPTRRSSTRSAGSRSSVVSVDFSGTEERKAARHYEPGDYAVKVKKAELTTSGEKKTKQVLFTLVFTDGPYKGKQVFHRCNLLPQSLWVLRNALDAMGMKTKKGKMNLDLRKYVGKSMGITIEDDEYEGKVRSVVADTFAVDELNARDNKGDDEELDDEDEELDDEEEDEEDEEDDDEDEEEEEDEDLEEIDLDEV